MLGNDTFYFRVDKYLMIISQASGGGCGHFIFEGPPGVGKRTMIWAMLREAFGRDTIHVRHDNICFED